jgi:hypothetical protein
MGKIGVWGSRVENEEFGKELLGGMSGILGGGVGLVGVGGLLN